MTCNERNVTAVKSAWLCWCDWVLYLLQSSYTNQMLWWVSDPPRLCWALVVLVFLRRVWEVKHMATYWATLLQTGREVGVMLQKQHISSTLLALLCWWTVKVWGGVSVWVLPAAGGCQQQIQLFLSSIALLAAAKWGFMQTGWLRKTQLHNCSLFSEVLDWGFFTMIPRVLTAFSNISSKIHFFLPSFNLITTLSLIYG